MRFRGVGLNLREELTASILGAFLFVGCAAIFAQSKPAAPQALPHEDASAAPSLPAPSTDLDSYNKQFLDANGGYKDKSGGYFNLKQGIYTDKDGGVRDCYGGYQFKDGSYKTGGGDFYDVAKSAVEYSDGEKLPIPGMITPEEAVQMMRKGEAREGDYDKDRIKNLLLEQLKLEHPRATVPAKVSPPPQSPLGQSLPVQSPAGQSQPSTPPPATSSASAPLTLLQRMMYVCNGERLLLESCNMQDFSDNSGCLVQHPDRPQHNGMVAYTNETRGTLKKLSPGCQRWKPSSNR